MTNEQKFKLAFGTCALTMAIMGVVSIEVYSEISIGVFFLLWSNNLNNRIKEK